MTNGVTDIIRKDKFIYFCSLLIIYITSEVIAGTVIKIVGLFTKVNTEPLTIQPLAVWSFTLV